MSNSKEAGAGAVCMDCLLASSDIESLNEKARQGYICEHWKPKYWEKKGFVRNWGDAAVMNWPHLEVLRRENRSSELDEVEFVVLAPFSLRRPLELYAKAGPSQRLMAWGAY